MPPVSSSYPRFGALLLREHNGKIGVRLSGTYQPGMILLNNRHLATKHRGLLALEKELAAFVQRYVQALKVAGASREDPIGSRDHYEAARKRINNQFRDKLAQQFRIPLVLLIRGLGLSPAEQETLRTAVTSPANIQSSLDEVYAEASIEFRK